MEVYDRRTNIIEVAGKEIVPYDVRLCFDAVPELVGIPFALLRGRRDTPHLNVVMQKPPSRDINGMGNRLRTVIREQLEIEARIEWAQELPERWKGVTVIDEKDWGAPHV